MSSTACAFPTGLAVGAGVMYFAGPRGGRRRRALVRDKPYRWAHDAAEYADKKSQHRSNVTHGMAHEARSMVPGMG